MGADRPQLRISSLPTAVMISSTLCIKCPAAIEILFHVHTNPGEFRKDDDGTVIGQDYLDYYEQHGIIEQTGCLSVRRKHPYLTTEKGRFFIDMICDTPFPEAKFVDPRFASNPNPFPIFP